MVETRLRCCMWKFWYFSIAKIWGSWSSSCLRVIPRFWSDGGQRQFCCLHWFGGGKWWMPESCSSDSQIIWSWFLFVRLRRLMGRSSKNNWPRDSACLLLVMLEQSKAGCHFLVVCWMLIQLFCLFWTVTLFFPSKAVAKSTLSKIFVLYTCCIFPVACEILAKL